MKPKQLKNFFSEQASSEKFKKQGSLKSRNSSCEKIKENVSSNREDGMAVNECKKRLSYYQRRLKASNEQKKGLHLMDFTPDLKSLNQMILSSKSRPQNSNLSQRSDNSAKNPFLAARPVLASLLSRSNQTIQN